MFLFECGLDPDEYARTLSFIEVRKQLTLVEVDTEKENPRLARVDKSLLSRRLNPRGKLTATDEEIVSDAREYWTCTTKSDYDVEILFSGRFKFTQIIRKAHQAMTNPSYTELSAQA